MDIYHFLLIGRCNIVVKVVNMEINYLVKDELYLFNKLDNWLESHG